MDEMIVGESDMRRLRLYMLMALLLLLTSCDGPVGFAFHNAKVDDHKYRIDYGVDTVMDSELLVSIASNSRQLMPVTFVEKSVVPAL